MLLHRRFALAIAALLVTGCSSSSSTDNKPPIIDDLTMPDTATQSKSDPTLYECVGTISAHDPDGVITKGRIYAQGAAPLDLDLAGPNVQPSFSKAQFVVQFAKAQSGATIPYEVAVIDNDGAESDHVKKTAKIP